MQPAGQIFSSPFGADTDVKTPAAEGQDDDDEIPLLEDLGIEPEMVGKKLLAVLT